MLLRPSREADLGWITALERRDDHLEVIGQWSDAQHLDAIDGRDAREPEEAERYDAVAEAPAAKCFRMRRLSPGQALRLQRPG